MEKLTTRFLSREKIFEYLLYLFFWSIILFSPMLESHIRRGTTDWSLFLLGLKFSDIYICIFLLNNLSLSFLFKERINSRIHTVIVLLCLALATIHSPFFKGEMRGSVDGASSFSRQAPNAGDPSTRHHRFEWKRPGMPPRFFPPVGNLLFALFVIGFNTAVKMQFRSVNKLRRLQELEKQHVETELAYLKNQINPHFFMNTLNNIHALIDIDSEKAKETVIELSKMMRYLLYESSRPAIPIEKELGFLNHFIELMRLRYTDEVEIAVSLPQAVPHVQVPPLLFLPFLENAFKHGISYRKKSYVRFSIEITDSHIRCVTANSNHPLNEKEEGGIGLDNVKKRLHLLYADNYTLEVKRSESEFNVELIIPVG